MLGLLPGLRPDFVVDGRPEALSMVSSISLVTLAATALILFVSRVKPDAVVTGSVMKAGIVAVISILGIAWLGSTFFESHRTEILSAMSDYVRQYPWLFSSALFLRPMPRSSPRFSSILRGRPARPMGAEPGFMRAGMVTTIVALAMGFVLARALYGP